MVPGLDLGVQGSVTAHHSRQNLLSGLDKSFGPTRLLRFKCSHLHRQFRGTLHILQVNKFPSLKLGAVGEVGIFGQRVVLPAAGFLDGSAPPDARGAIEVEEEPGARATGMLQHKVAVQQNSFDLSQKRVMAVEMRPARLHHADARIGEVMDGPQQKIFRGSEVGVENGDELTLRRLHPFRQSARLEARAVGSMMVADRITQRRIPFDQPASHVDGLIGRVVQHLDVQLFPGILQLADRVQQALDYVLLVKNRQLHRHPRQVFKKCGGFGRALFPVFVIEVHQNVAVHSVARQQNQHDEVRDE